MPVNPIEICHSCPLKEFRADESRVICTASGKNIAEHAREDSCPHDFFSHPASEAPVETILSLMAGGKKWLNWHTWPNVQAVYRRLCADAIAAIPTCLDPGRGRGIIIVGGGKYFLSAITNIRLIRRLGCELPILLVGLDSELPEWQRELVARDGVRCATWSEIAPGHPVGKHHGWELKTICALYSPYAQTLILDADSFPQKDPTPLFDSAQFAEHGAVFWPDLPNLKREHVLGDNMPAAVWEMLGVSVRDIPALESGQALIDKARWWRGLWLSGWFCRNGWDYYFKFPTWYGDKNCPQAAAAVLGMEYASPAHRPLTASAPMLLQRDFDGSPLFGHYTQPKWWIDWIDRPHFVDIPQDATCMKIFKQAREDFWQAQPKPFVIGITVCVGYEDYLEETAQNVKQIDDWLIVTVPGDPAIEVCKRLGLWCIESTRLNYEGSKFNLGALRNDGLWAAKWKYKDRDDAWALFLDADCRLPGDAREQIQHGDLDPRYLIGAHRRHVDGTPATDWNVTGFFQLFHLGHFPRHKYRENHIDAGKTDIWFRDLWRSHHLSMLPLTVDHLGVTGIDWEGRVSVGPVEENPAPKPVKIYGLQRCGTNLAAWLLDHNFAVDRLAEHRTGWKHGWHDPTIVPDDARFVLCVKHPLAHLLSFYRYLQRDFAIDHTAPTQFRCDMSFEDFLASPCYEFNSPAHRYAEMYRHWLDALTPQRTHIVRQEDQVANQAKVMHGVRRKLSLSPKVNRWETSTKQVDVGAQIVDRAPVQADYAAYTPQMLEKIESIIPGELLARLGYPASIREPMTLKKVAHGALGMVKAIGHINRVGDEVIENRRAICADCKHVVKDLLRVKTCNICSCKLWAKLVNAEEACPLGKWAAVQ